MVDHKEPETLPPDDQVAKLIARGYRRVSRAFGIVARIDRPDWKEYLAKKMCTTVELIDGDPTGLYADQYRRVHSKDQITLKPYRRALRVPHSTGDCTGYVP